MQEEIWSDVVCPWCYIGKRRFETALGQFVGRDAVRIVWRSFELDPSAPKKAGEDMATRLSKKYRMNREQALESMRRVTDLAMAEGLEYHMDTVKPTNSFDAHRLLQLASRKGRGNQMKERLLKSYFTDSLDISDEEVLVSLGAEVGIEVDEIRSMCASDLMADDVRNDEALAAKYGINGVPFFVFDSKYGVSGAQEAETFLEVLNKVADESSPLNVLGDASAESCTDESCSI